MSQTETEPDQQTAPDPVTLTTPDGEMSRDFEADDPGSINTARALGWATTDEHAAGQAATEAHEAYLAAMYDDIGTTQVNTVATEGTAGSSQDPNSQAPKTETSHTETSGETTD